MEIYQIMVNIQSYGVKNKSEFMKFCIIDCGIYNLYL